MKRICCILASLLCALPVWAEPVFRVADNTHQALDELSRRCERHRNNTDHDVVLLAGQLLQTRFGRTPPVRTCVPTEKRPCFPKDWYPPEFTGVMIHTNRHKAKEKVSFTVKDFYYDEKRALDFVVGKAYAVCAEMGERPNPHVMPEYTIYSYQTIYELK